MGWEPSAEAFRSLAQYGHAERLQAVLEGLAALMSDGRVVALLDDMVRLISDPDLRLRFERLLFRNSRFQTAHDAQPIRRVYRICQPVLGSGHHRRLHHQRYPHIRRAAHIESY